MVARFFLPTLNAGKPKRGRGWKCSNTRGNKNDVWGGGGVGGEWRARRRNPRDYPRRNDRILYPRIQYAHYTTTMVYVVVDAFTHFYLYYYSYYYFFVFVLARDFRAYYNARVWI